MATEDNCDVCNCTEAWLAIQVVMPVRNPQIETLIYPMCETCYCTLMEDDGVLLKCLLIVREPIPKHIPHKNWTWAAYQASWVPEERLS